MSIKRPTIRYGRLALITFLTLVRIGSFAQGKLISRYEIVAGAGILRNSGSDYADQDRDTKFGYCVGAGAYHTFRSSFELNVRVLWERKGFKAHEGYHNPFTKTDEVVGIDRNIDYVTMSLVPMFHLGSKKKVLLGVGGYYSFLNGAKDKVTRWDKSGNIIYQFEAYSTGNAANDAGFILCAGYSLSIAKTNECRILLVNNIGVTYFTESFGYNIRNNILSIVISYTFLNPKGRR